MTETKRIILYQPEEGATKAWVKATITFTSTYPVELESEAYMGFSDLEEARKLDEEAFKTDPLMVLDEFAADVTVEFVPPPSPPPEE
jgi:hypothetical protein